MLIEIIMNGQRQARESSESLCHKALENQPMNRAEFMAYLQAIANDYWQMAEDNEDEPPESLGAADRIGDFAIYLNEHCR